VNFAAIFSFLIFVLQPVPAAWQMYQAVASHNAVFARPGFRATWVAQLGDRINGGLAVVGDTVYADSFDQRLYALNLTTGDILWRARTNNVLMSTPIVDDGLVVVGSGHNGFLDADDSAQVWGRATGDDVIAFDLQGRKQWSFHTIGEDMPSAATDGKILAFANGDLHAYGLQLSNGHELWQTALSGIDTMSSATLAGNRLFIGLCHNMPHFQETIALDIRSGRTLWKNPNGSCDASPAVDKGVVFVDGNDEGVTGPYEPGGRDIVAAIDERTGRTIWTHVSSAGPYSIVASGEHAIAGTAVNGVLYQSIVNQDRVIAFDERTGRVLWTVRTVGPVKMSPVVVDQRVIFGDTTGILYSVERRNGVLRHTTSFKDPFSTSPPVIVGETLLIANGRYIFAIPTSVI
jgi:outer membrane protein assembly factor BamB